MYGSYNTAYPKKNVEEAMAVIKHSEYAPELASREQLMEALEPNKIVVVSAWAEWCNPCKVACKKLDALITTPSDPRDPKSSRILDYIENGYIQFFSDNIDKEETSVHRNQVSVVPTFFIYYNKKLIEVLTNLEFDKMVVMIQQLLTQEYQRRQPLLPSLPPETLQHVESPLHGGSVEYR